MPASALRRRTPEPAQSVQPPRRRFGLAAAAAAIALIALIVAFLPASLILRFLPPVGVQVGDTSGTIWHGAASDIIVDGRRGGAAEWTIKPWPLLAGRLEITLRWALGGILAECEARLDGKRVRLAAVRADGPLEDLAELGVGANWSGRLEVAIDELDAAYARDPWRITAIFAAHGALRVRNLTARPSGARLGDYELEFPPGAAAGDSLSGTLRDLGGPLEARGSLRIDFAPRQLLVHGGVRERPGAPLEVVEELKSAARLGGRDAAGRVPVDIEISF